MSCRRRILQPPCVLAVAAASLAAGASAARAQAPPPPTAPTLASALPCYSTLAHVELTGDGWTPSGRVRLQARYVNDGSAFDSTVTADAAGHISFVIAAPTFSALGANTDPVSVTAE